MATLCARFSAGFMSLQRINSPLCRALQQVKCTPVPTDGMCIMFRRGMAGGNAPKFFIKAPEYSERTMMRKFVKYLAYTGVPLFGLATFVNIFIGPAQLREIPEGYRPQHWEYYEHPIERWFARYVYPNPQKHYEKYAHFIEEQNFAKEARQELVAVKKLMAEKGEGFEFIRATPGYHAREEED